MKDLKHIRRFNESDENLNIFDDWMEFRSSSDSASRSSKKIENIKVKHLIEYLNTLNPEAGVSLDKDGWDYDVDVIETIKNNGLFDYQEGFGEDGEDILFINN